MRKALVGQFFGRLRVEYFNGRQWPLINPPGPEQFGFLLSDGRTVIPANRFVTDFASIPRLFWRILPPTGDGARARYGIAAVIHDWLYSCGMIDGNPIRRAIADDIFGACMRASGVSKTRRFLMYWAVRAFGFRAWSRMVKDRRILLPLNRIPKVDAEMKLVKKVKVRSEVAPLP